MRTQLSENKPPVTGLLTLKNNVVYSTVLTRLFAKLGPPSITVAEQPRNSKVSIHLKYNYIKYYSKNKNKGTYIFATKLLTDREVNTDPLSKNPPMMCE